MTRVFVHDDTAVSVDAPDADLTWLREFLEPAFAIDDGGRGDVTIAFEATPAPVSASETTRHSAAAFTLDSGSIRLPAFQIPGGTRLHDATRGLTIDVTLGSRDVRIGYHANRLTARFALMRVVREYAHNHSILTGGVMLHASAVTVGGAAIAIAGSKGAGKTTLALRLLAIPGVGYLSNDRVLVRLAPHARVLAVPTVVALRAGTRALMGDVTTRLQLCGDFREHAGERHATGPVPPVIVGDAWNVSPCQLGTALDRQLHASAALAAVILPTRNAAAHNRLRRMSPLEATEALEQSVLCRRSGQYVSDVFVTTPESAPDANRLRSRCQTIASAVPCFSCSLSDDTSSEDLQTLIRGCLQGRVDESG